MLRAALWRLRNCHRWPQPGLRLGGSGSIVFVFVFVAESEGGAAVLRLGWVDGCGPNASTCRVRCPSRDMNKRSPSGDGEITGARDVKMKLFFFL